MTTIIAFSKRFTSPVMDWPFPTLNEVEGASPGDVGGVRAWTRLEMDHGEGLVVLRYAMQKVSFSRVELLADGNELVGRTASDMRAAKGFSTSRPGLPPDPESVPVLRVSDVRAWLERSGQCLKRPEVELAVGLGLAARENVAVHGHELEQVTFNGQAYILPALDPDTFEPDPLTAKAVPRLWRRGGVASKAPSLWPRHEMLTSTGAGVFQGFVGRKKLVGHVIPTEYPLTVVEVFAPGGRYLWFKEDARFQVQEAWMETAHLSVEGRRKLLHDGSYHDVLPGEYYPQGWAFMLALYQELQSFPGLKFRVTSPGKCWRAAGPHINLRLLPDRLRQRFEDKFNLRWGDIMEKDWNDEFVVRIVGFLRSVIPVVVLEYDDREIEIYADGTVKCQRDSATVQLPADWARVVLPQVCVRGMPATVCALVADALGVSRHYRAALSRYQPYAALEIVAPPREKMT